MTTVAPSCPINRVYTPPQPRSQPLPMPPRATDLNSLIRSVNITRDILRSLTTSLTVNNVFNPPTQFARAEGSTYYSAYPAWLQISIETMSGHVFHKEGGDIDDSQRAAIRRTNTVEFQNTMQEDPDFFWRYYLPLDQMSGSP